MIKINGTKNVRRINNLGHFFDRTKRIIPNTFPVATTNAVVVSMYAGIGFHDGLYVKARKGDFMMDLLDYRYIYVGDGVVYVKANRFAGRAAIIGPYSNIYYLNILDNTSGIFYSNNDNIWKLVYLFEDEILYMETELINNSINQYSNYIPVNNWKVFGADIPVNPLLLP